jgi:Ca-activated chloride channel family protein
LDTFSEDNAAAFLPRIWAMRRVGFLMDQIALHGEDSELIDELIALSRDYGIMTPYTSFLAEENTHLGDAVALRKLGEVATRGLRESSGWRGQQNAQVRYRLGRARNAPAQVPLAPVPSDGMGGGAYGPGAGMGYGGGPAYGSVPAPVILGGSNQAAFEAAGAGEAVRNLRQVGNYTLYNRGNQWYTPDLANVDVDGDTGDIKTMTQFDEAYFTLAAANRRFENELLATQQPGEELLIRLRGQLYRILPAATEATP